MTRQAWRLAVGTLTTVRVHAPDRVDTRVAGRAMLLAPVAVLVLAIPAGAAYWLVLVAGGGSLLAAALAIGVLRLGDRAFHLDGLADTADGLAASYDRERALAIMRTGDTGPAGAAAVVLVLIVQVVAAARIGELAGAGHGQLAVAVAGCVLLSRGMLPVACLRGIPAARGNGLGVVVAGSTGPVVTVGVVLVVTGLLTAGLVSVGQIAAEFADSLPWWSAVVAAAAALGATAAVLARCVRRFGGITGDVLGAVVEVALAAALTGVALAAGAG